jgi:5-(carboxyamino)imidazole ribonucleotide synthase
VTATVGILGGGQLGRMLALAGIPLGVRCLVLEPSPGAPAAAAADVLPAPFDDRVALDELARRCDVVTIEVEHVPVESLAWLAARLPVHPSPEVVAVAQDRLAEKRLFQRLRIPTAPFAEPDGLSAAFPGGTVVKRRTGGFDGRGQVRVEAGAPASAVREAAGAIGAPCLAEGLVAFRRELSLVGARGTDGTIVHYPLVENCHRDGLLRETLAPAVGVPASLEAEAVTAATRIMEELDHVGVLALELFESEGGLLANELAPRVHNSGHWTIEGAVTSQFEQHLRAVLGLPLGDTAVTAPAAMVNVIGAEPDPAAVLAVPGAHLHLYGKAGRPDRKIGHVTVIGTDERERDERFAAVRRIVGSPD